MEIQNKNGTSLAELLIYMAIMVILTSAIISFIVLNKKIGDRNEAINEVEFQGQEIVEIISQTIRNGKSINVPALGGSGSQLSLVVDVSGDSPIVFDLVAGKMRIKRGAGVATNLNSDKVVISNLIFKNIGNAGTIGSINFQFNVKYLNPMNKTELNYAKTFFNSGSLR